MSIALDRAPKPTPQDAIALARRKWLRGESVDMGALATELDTSRATLYRWVGSRERLIGEALWSLFSEIFEEGKARASGSGAALIHQVFEHGLRTMGASPAMRAFIARDPEYALRVLTSKASVVQGRAIAAFRDLIAEQPGYTHPLDPDTLAYLTVRIAESFLYTDVITGGEPDLDKAVAALAVMLGTEPK
ncbi:MAG: QsdR family transcriptional regulator [Thermoleophilaceae bacterium]